MKKTTTAIHYLFGGFIILAAALFFSLSYGSVFSLGLLGMTMSLCAIITLFKGVAMLHSAGVFVFSAKPSLKGAAAALPCGAGILVALLVSVWLRIFENAALTAWAVFLGAFIGGLCSFYLAGIRLAKKAAS